VTSRREVLKGMAAGSLLVAFHPARALAKEEAASVAGWLRIAPDGVVTILTNTSEIGQGTGTAIAQLVADELDVPWDAIRLEMAPVEKSHFNPGFKEYATYGSGGVSHQAEMFRTAGARARAMLIEAAARRWKVAASECTARAGQVRHDPSSRKLAYGTLASEAAGLATPEKPELKKKEAWQYIGKPMPRLDLPAKVNGTAVYGLDVKLPGLLVATIAQCPSFGGRLASVDPGPALAVHGVKRVIQLENAVAVVASGYWPARRGLLALKPVWDLSNASTTDSREYDERLAAAAAGGGGVPFAPKGSSAETMQAEHEKAMAKAARRLESIYQVGFAAHATMEPMNATARPIRDGMELWLPTQVQSASREAVAKRLGLSPEKVQVQTTLAGGGFGRRAELDFAVQAAEIASKMRAPVKLIWSREEDLQHDYYRPASAMRIRAGLDDRGMPVAWSFETACASLLEYSRGGAFKVAEGSVDPTALMGLVRPGYKLSAPRFGWTRTDAGVPVAFWRSVGASQNVFALESFIDEIAEAAGKDPLQIRLDLLEGSPRERRTVEAAAGAAGWSQPAPAGHHRGLSLARANGSVVAQVVELSVEGERVRLHRVTCAIDCGLAVNPNSVKAQMEGGIAFGLTTAFLGEITVAGGRVEQQNFDGFPLLSLAQMPAVEVVIVESTEPPGGCGEEAVAPVAPAVANALRAATGKRVRRLPFSRAGLSIA
jgi:isoquinoline 1-oxidoreductase beta subunit